MKAACVIISIFCLICAPTFAQEEIKIGALFSLSGWGAWGGTSELNGIQMALEEVNAKRIAPATKFKLVVEDNRSDLRASVDAFKKLTSVDKVPVVIGPNWSEFVDVVAPLASNMHVPVISPSGYKQKHLKADPWVFVLWPPPSVATRGLAEYIAKQGHKEISVLISENSYYQGILDAMRPQLESKGIKILDVFNFPPQQTDYRTIIAKLSSSSTDAVLTLLLESGEFAAFLRQRRELKLDLPLYAANTIPFDQIVQKNLNLAEGIVYFDYLTPGTESFKQKYRDRFKSEPGFASAKAYDAMHLLAQLIDKCGATPKQIRNCLKTAKFSGISGEISFSDKGLITDSSANTYLLSVKNSQIVKLSGKD